ncbi:MAG: 50S ribosomal protein L31 [Chloroflexaceae bacterium]|nr:50S ribosomal protein L31 [Chloroflexaceae bacterium]
MKKDIHPKYFETDIVCSACGTVWKIGSTRNNLRVSICANCHPFFTGDQRVIVDTEGQVDRFMKRLATAQQKQASAEKRKQEKRQQPRKKSLLEEVYGSEEADATVEDTESA